MLLYIKNKPFGANNSVHLSKSETHGRAKTGNETSAGEGSGNFVNFGLRGHEPIFFHAYEMLFLSTNGPFNFYTAKYIKFRLYH